MNEMYNINGVSDIPYTNSRAAFLSVASQSVFKENGEIVPLKLSDKVTIMPWGADNQMPFRLLDLVEKDETLSTCQIFNAELCYGGGLIYNAQNCSQKIKSEIDEFMINNSGLASYFLGVCQDFKHFGFAVSVIILDKLGKKIVHIVRKEACYCRFAPADKDGRITKIYYGTFRDNAVQKSYEEIELLDMALPWADLQGRIESQSTCRKFAIVTKIPTPDSTYYPIPPYASLFRGNWYNIKQLIGIAKEAKLRNSAPIKYLIEINDKYWEQLFRVEGITDPIKKQDRVKQAKTEILDFLTGAENTGKVWFSQFWTSPDGKEQSFVKINKIENSKEGGDWATDIQEAVNMMCFTLRVHSNLVGSVPGKAQTNNSGSDKRELYTIAQSLQKPYHDLLFLPHRIVMKFNGWKGAYPDCPFIMLTTLDENTDAKTVTTERYENN